MDVRSSGYGFSQICVGRLLPFLLLLALFVAASCDSTPSAGPVSGAGEPRSARESGPSTATNPTPAPPAPASEVERIKAELRDRSFRQFVPSKDASPRRGVILSFFGQITIWAQYAESGHALNEWEISADDYRIELHDGTSEITLHLDAPRSAQGLPTQCDDCISTEGVSLSIRNVYNSERIEFRLNDPNGVLPPPFPVFASWTRFTEDEIMN